MRLERSALKMIPYTRLRWECQVKGCTNGTHVLDYGIAPYYFLDRNSKNSQRYPELYWRNLREKIYLCGKHYKWVVRLKKRFDWNHIYDRLCEPYHLSKKLLPVPTKNKRHVPNNVSSEQGDESGDYC